MIRETQPTLEFDSKERLIYKKEPSGLIWEFAYEQEDLRFPTKITDPKGGITECRYSPSGHPIYLKNAIGAEWRFFFDDNGNFLGQREPNGRAIWNIYGEKNRLNQSFLKVALEIEEKDHFAVGYRRLTAEGGYTNYFSYDPQTGQVASRTNTRGAKTSFAYDNHGQLKTIRFPTGYLVDRKWDEKGKILETSDRFGMQKRYDYDETDRLKTIQTALGATHFLYDQAGNPKLIIDPKGVTTSYHYDSEENLKEVIDGEEGISSYEYNLLNQLVHTTLPNGSCKTMEYDSFGRLYREIYGE